MIVGFTTTYAIGACRHWGYEFASRSGWGVQNYGIKFRQFAAGRWLFPGLPVSSTNKTDHHDITEILLKVALNTIKPNELDFNRDNSLKQHSKGKHRTHYPDTEPDRLCCYSLIYIVSLLNLETADTNFIVFCLIRPGIIEPMIYTALQPITLSFTPPRLWIFPLMNLVIIEVYYHSVDTFARGLIQALDYRRTFLSTFNIIVDILDMLIETSACDY